MKYNKRVAVRLSDKQHEFLSKEGKISENIKGCIDLIMELSDKNIEIHGN